MLPHIFWIDMHCYSDLTLPGQEQDTDDRVDRWKMVRLNVKRKSKYNIKLAEGFCKQSLVNQQTASKGEERRTQPKEFQPFTYSYSKTESQLHPPPRSLLSNVLPPFVGELSSALQYGKGQESQG